MLVFDEEKQYDNLLANGFEKFPNARDLTILCKQWLKNGTRFDFLKERMVDFCSTWNTQFNYAKSERLFLTVLANIENESNTEKKWEFSKKIKIYKEEIKEILKVQDLNQKKYLFTMICLAKWRNANFIYLNSGSSIKIGDINDLTGLKLTKKQRLEILHELQKQKIIDMQLKPLLKTFIPCICFEGEEILEFDVSSDFMLKLEECEKYKNATHCERCGKLFIKNNNKQKYCEECAKIVASMQKIASRERLRKIENY